MSALRPVCPVCAQPTPLRGQRFVPHERPAQPGEDHLPRWCEGQGQEPTPEALLTALDASVREAEAALRVACTRYDLAALAVTKAHQAFVTRRAWALRVGAQVAGGAE